MSYEVAKRNRMRVNVNLQKYAEMMLTKSKYGKYVCPFCGSGLGVHGTGAFSVYENEKTNGPRWHCFSCGRDGDLLDLIGAVEEIEGHAAQLERAASIFGVELEHYHGATAEEDFRDFLELPEQPEQKPPEQPEQPEQDYSDFFRECNQRLDQTNYHRGVSRETLDRFCVGFCPDWKHSKLPHSTPTPRLIIPNSKYSYTARDMRDNLTNAQKKYAKLKEGKQRIFNLDALETSQQPIFIVEGELDALSIIDVGGAAVALGSTNMKGQFLDAVKQHRPAQPLIISLDNDAPGMKAAQELQEGLDKAGIFSLQANVAGDCKDANELLQKDREALRGAVKMCMEESLTEETIATARNDDELIRRLRVSVDEYQQLLMRMANSPCVPTGFDELDKLLDGGLYEGLYILGAVSSAGKTSLLLQIADQIAQSGQDVLYFSLEMGKHELITRSISRLSFQIARAEYGDSKAQQIAKNYRGVSRYDRYKDYGPEELDTLQRARETYREYAEKNLLISAGIGGIGVKQVTETARDVARIRGKSPVIMIDYLQILEPSDPRSTDKQNTDKAVKELKLLSAELHTPVLAISSFNRDSYKDENGKDAGMTAFKESGAIEYSADALLALQYLGTGKKDLGFDRATAETKNPAELELKIIKARNDRKNCFAYLRYWYAFNVFENPAYIQNSFYDEGNNNSSGKKKQKPKNRC